VLSEGLRDTSMSDPDLKVPVPIQAQPQQGVALVQ